MSPASRLIVGSVLVDPAVSVTEPSALRKPLAVAIAVYVPAGAARLKVPLALATTDAASVSSALYRRTVTGLPASTCPVNVPAGRGVGEGEDVAVGVDENWDVGVGERVDVRVNVGVGENWDVGVGENCDVGVDERMDVGVGVGVDVRVGVGVNVLPEMVRLAGVDEIAVSRLLPWETRAVQSIAV
jgi:hypothetical protein